MCSAVQWGDLGCLQSRRWGKVNPRELEVLGAGGCDQKEAGRK